ncbi:MAG: FMN-binding protein [Spirochaetaceae bacterium]|nr:MAG: FMN-binding protein [Spirochaetaceae bacterium]
MKKDGMPYTIIFSFIVCFVFVFVLSFTNEGTRELVEFNQQVARQKAILNAIGIEYESDDQVPDLFERVERIERNGQTFLRTERDGRTVYATEFAGAGLWGVIEGVLAVDAEVSRTVGLEIISHNETPGLGGRIDEPWYKNQFRDIRIRDDGFRLPRGVPADPDEGMIDAVTGATRTSESMVDILSGVVLTMRSTLGR